MRHRLLLLVTTLLAGGAIVVGSGDAVAVPPPGSPYHLLFATSNLYEITVNQSFPPSGMEFGNITGADWQVTYSAVNAGLSGADNWNGAAIRYRSLLSISGDTLRNRLDVAGPVYNTNGTLLATSEADLFDGSLQAPVDYDEFGTYFHISQDRDVWTGATGSGFWAGDSCGNWSNRGLQGRVGDAFVQDGSWLSAGFTKGCTQTARVYGISPPLPLPLWCDYNGDGAVDAADYTVWRDSGGLAKPWSTRPYDDVGVLAGEDDDLAYYGVWPESYGQTLPADAGAVPEPTACVLTLAVVPIVAAVRRRRAG